MSGAPQDETEPGQAALGARTFLLRFAAVLAILLSVAYANSLNIGFYYDDAYQIANNESIRSLRNVPRFFWDASTASSTNSRSGIRPVLICTYALNYAISGLRPWSYHVLQIVLHFFNAILVFLIVRDHLWSEDGKLQTKIRASVPAAVAALLFALSPLNSHSLDYMSARSAVLATTLYLLAFRAYLEGQIIRMALFEATGLLCKEIVATLPLVLMLHLLVYTHSARKQSVREILRQWKTYVLPIVASIAVIKLILIYRNHLPSVAGPSSQVAPPSAWHWMLTGWSSYLYYAGQFLWPDGMTIEHDAWLVTSFADRRAWLPLMIISGWWFGAFALMKKCPHLTFATGWFFATLSLETTWIPLGEVINDHRPYIASTLGLSVLVTSALVYLSGAGSRVGWRRLVVSCSFLILVALPAIWYRNWVWQDDARLWLEATRKSPNHSRAWLNAGVALMGRGRLDEARYCFQQARRLAPGYAKIYWNLAVLEAHQGQFSRALSAAEEGLRLAPNSAMGAYYKGMALEKTGKEVEALSYYRAAVKIEPVYHEAHAGIQRLAHFDLMEKGVNALYVERSPVKAVDYFRAVLKEKPRHYGATFQLARALDRSGKPTEALPFWTEMLRMAEQANDQATLKEIRKRLAN